MFFFSQKSYFCTFPGEISCRSRACNSKKRLPGRFGKPGNDYEYDEAGYSGDDYDEDYKIMIMMRSVIVMMMVVNMSERQATQVSQANLKMIMNVMVAEN